MVQTCMWERGIMLLHFDQKKLIQQLSQKPNVYIEKLSFMVLLTCVICALFSSPISRDYYWSVCDFFCYLCKLYVFLNCFIKST